MGCLIEGLVEIACEIFLGGFVELAQSSLPNGKFNGRAYKALRAAVVIFSTAVFISLFIGIVLMSSDDIREKRAGCLLAFIPLGIYLLLIGISCLIRAFRRKNLTRDAVSLFLENEKRYIMMSNKEFAALPREELFDAALARVFAIAEKYGGDEGEALLHMTEGMRAFYTVSLYYMEVNNGGLCQFFANSSSSTAPSLASALAAVGADEHKALYLGFVTENGIDLFDLSSFKSESSEEFAGQYGRYPFEKFDLEYESCPDLRDVLSDYILKNICEFWIIESIT